MLTGKIRKIGLSTKVQWRSFSRSRSLSLAKPVDEYIPTRTTQSLSSQISAAFDLLDYKSITPIRTLLSQLSNRSMKELQMGLSYESTPDNDRAVNTKQTPSNEVLLIAHIARPSPHLRLADRISICAGFAVAAGENDESPLVVSCTHTLNSMKSALSDTSTDTPSATLILTYDNGSITDIRSAESLESCLPLNDIVFYKPSATLFGKGQNLRTLPVNPYPPPPRAPVAVWLPPNTTMDAPEWTFGSIDRYTTPNAKLAQIGTYDHLANVEINDAIPRLGASGSPIIEIESGAVCAIVKGAISTYPKSRGWATPAERVWECFDLPGLKFR